MTAEQKELLDAIQVLIDKAMSTTTKVYGGRIVSVNGKNCQVETNGRTYNLRCYGGTPSVNDVCKVIVPQNNMSIAFALV